MTTYDLSLYDQNMALSAILPAGVAVTGPLKASQRFANAFLTERGTYVYDTTYGAEFITLLNHDLIRTDFDVVMYFNEAVGDILYYFNNKLTGDEPDNEVIDSVTLDNFELYPPELMLNITVTTRDGTSREITIPVRSVEVS